MNQPVSDFTPLARRTDPQTSIDAGRKAKERIVALHERLIIECLRLHGPQTAKEMEAYTGLSNIQISRRSGGLMSGLNKRCRYTDKRRNGCSEWELIDGR